MKNLPFRYYNFVICFKACFLIAMTGLVFSCAADISEDKEVRHRITYELNGGYWCEGYSAPQTFTENAFVELPSVYDISKEYYSFGGWYTDESLKNRVSGAQLADLTQDVKLYAKWVDTIETYWATAPDVIKSMKESGKIFVILDENATPDICIEIKKALIYLNSYVSRDIEVELDFATKSEGFCLQYLPDEAFSSGYENNYNLTGIRISVSDYIGDGAFSCCVNLRYAYVSALKLGVDVFSGCKNLSDLKFYACEVGKFAFMGCENLVNIDLSECSRIGYLAFGNCSKLEVVKLAPYVELGLFAFSGCSSLKTVYMPETITDISDGEDCCYDCYENRIPGGLFEGCDSLENLVIPDSVVEIGGYAFAGCNSLKKIVIPEGVVKIGEGAFLGCREIESINLPSGITEIEGRTFDSCVTLSEIQIPEGVTIIGPRAFTHCTGLSDIKLPDSLKEIGIQAFSFCENLKEIIIPEGIETISPFTFWECTSLTNVSLPDSLKNIWDGAFKNCASLESLTVPEGVVSIGVEAFRDCVKLNNIKLPQTLTSIGDCLFWGCTSLTEISFPCVYSYSNDGFYRHYCSAIIHDFEKNIYVCLTQTFSGTECWQNDFYQSFSPKTDTYSIPNACFYGCKNLKTVTIADGTEKICNLAFYGCSSLEEIVIPDSVETLELEVFNDCTSLKKVVTGNSLKTIPDSLFKDLPSLENVIIGNSVEEIGSYAFSGFKKLTGTLELPSSVKKIGFGAFRDCVNIKAVVLPQGLEDLYEQVFRGCTSLEELSLPQGITTIPAQVCMGCKQLEEVIIPQAVTVIYGSAFRDCAIKTVSIPASVVSVDPTCFAGCTELETINVDELNPVYKSIAGVLLRKYEDELAIELCPEGKSGDYIVPSGVMGIGHEAFMNCQKITSVVLSDECCNICPRAFEGCTKLTAVVFPHPEGWKYENFPVSSSDLSDPALAASNLKGKYLDYQLWYWNPYQ